jgi:hypothetical protein
VNVFECAACSHQWQTLETNAHVPVGADRTHDRPDRSRASEPR